VKWISRRCRPRWASLSRYQTHRSIRRPVRQGRSTARRASAHQRRFPTSDRWDRFPHPNRSTRPNRFLSPSHRVPATRRYRGRRDRPVALRHQGSVAGPPRATPPRHPVRRAPKRPGGSQSRSLVVPRADPCRCRPRRHGTPFVRSSARGSDLNRQPGHLRSVGPSGELLALRLERLAFVLECSYFRLEGVSPLADDCCPTFVVGALVGRIEHPRLDPVFRIGCARLHYRPDGRVRRVGLGTAGVGSRERARDGTAREQRDSQTDDGEGHQESDRSRASHRFSSSRECTKKTELRSNRLIAPTER